MGDLVEAERLGQDTKKFVAPLGDVWLTMILHHTLRHTYSVWGQSEKELHEAIEERRIGQIGSDQNTISWGLYGMAYAKARMGMLSEAHEHIRDAFSAIENLGEVRLTQSVLFDHFGFVCMQSSDYETALVQFENAIKIIQKNFLFLEYGSRCFTMSVECLLGPNWASEPAIQKFGRANWLSWKARIFASRFPTVRPLTLRILGRLSYAKGRTKKATKYFHRSIAAARELGAEYDLARALLDLATVSDPSESTKLRTEAVTILKRIKAVIPNAESWQLGDQHDEACVAPRFPLPTQ